MIEIIALIYAAIISSWYLYINRDKSEVSKNKITTIFSMPYIRKK